MANFLTKADIRTAIAKQIKDPDESWADLIDTVINQVYLTEVMQSDEMHPWFWLVKPLRRQFKAPVNITNITQVTPPVITTDGDHYLSTGDVVSVWDVVGMVEINLDHKDYADDFYHEILYLVGSTPTDDTLTLTDLDGDNVDATAWTAYTSGGKILHHGWRWPISLSQVLNVSIHDGLPLEKISWNLFHESPDRWIDSSQSTPEAYIYEPTGNSAGTDYELIMTFPGASENKIAYVNAVYAPSRLDADADVPLLPYQFHDIIVTGAVARLAENNVQVENAVIWPGLYAAQLEALKDYNRRWWAEHKALENNKPYGLLS